jgi:branched-chain amino acid transport system ATP-binding protein
VTLLEVTGLTRRFGGLVALDQVDLAVQAGDIVGLIGPNGAGKSTLLSILAGAQRPTRGRVVFDGRDVTGWRPYQAAHAGVARTFQLTRMFDSMTVLDHLVTAAYLRHPHRRDARTVARTVCDEFELTALAHQRASTLPPAWRKRVELARAMATRPRLLLLDEVLSGLTTPETAAAVGLVERIHAAGITIVMVEHVLDVVMALCSRVHVLNFGQTLFDGTSAAATSDPAVITAYLGTDADA